VANRLSPVPVSYLLERRKLIPVAKAVVTGKPYWGGGVMLTTVANIIELLRRQIGFPADVMAHLVEVLRSPSQDELDDLSLADTFWGIALPPDPSVDAGAAFFFPPKAAIPDPANATYRTSPMQEIVFPGIQPRRVRFWEFDTSRPWGNAKRFLVNMLTAERAMDVYPWPAPANYVQVYWTNIVKPQLKILVFDALVLSEGDARTFITITLVQNYADILSEVEDYLKEKEERAMKKAFIKMAAIAAFGLVFIVAGVSTLLVTGVQAAMKGFTAGAAADAATNMEKIAKQFATSDAAFSEEVQRVAVLINAEAAMAARNAPLSPEERAALTEDKGAYTVEVEGKVVGTADTPGGASKLGLEKSAFGERVEILYWGRPAGLAIRTAEGLVPVDQKMEKDVQSLPADEVKKLSLEAVSAPPSKAGWLLPAAGLALAVAGKMKGMRRR
jgi:hypothetical protein